MSVENFGHSRHSQLQRKAVAVIFNIKDSKSLNGRIPQQKAPRSRSLSRGHGGSNQGEKERPNEHKIQAGKPPLINGKSSGK